MKDDIDLLLEDLETLPESPESARAIEEVKAYINGRDAQPFEPELPPATTQP